MRMCEGVPMRIEKAPLMRPQTGDVLVSNPTATVEYEVSIVPAPPSIVCPNHDSALETGCALARDRQVDVWLTENHRHFLKIASHRSGVGESR